MREVLVAMSDKEWRRLVLDTIDRAGEMFVARRAEEARPRAQAGLRSEIVHARNRQTAADHVARQAGAGLPVAAHREQGGVVPARGMTAQKYPRRVAAECGCVAMKPGDRGDRIVYAGGEEMRRSEPITDGAKGH